MLTKKQLDVIFHIINNVDDETFARAKARALESDDMSGEEFVQVYSHTVSAVANHEPDTMPTASMLLTVERARNADLQAQLAGAHQVLHNVNATSADELLRLRAQLKVARAEIARKEVYIQQLQRKVRAALIQDQPAQEA
ncbi:MAG: hypothetical protein KA760_11815 [Steroidobacteraceae bacterium]|nr:hypothetical protein [Steroidobacteraceae bacterium]